MEALTPILQNISKVAQPVMGGMGVVSNLIGANRQNSIQQRAIQQQRELQQLASNPAAMSARVRAAEQPLSQNLVSNVGNEVQGYLAERGLGTSPQIAQSVMGQALAPYELESQKMAQAQVLQSMGMSQEAINQLLGSNIGAPTDTSGFWQQLQQFNQPKTVNSGLGGSQPKLPPSTGGADFPGTYADSGGIGAE